MNDTAISMLDGMGRGDWMGQARGLPPATIFVDLDAGFMFGCRMDVGKNETRQTLDCYLVRDWPALGLLQNSARRRGHAAT